MSAKRQTALKFLCEKLHLAPANHTCLLVRWIRCCPKLSANCACNLGWQRAFRQHRSTPDPTILFSWHSCATTKSTASVPLSVRQHGIAPSCHSYASSLAWWGQRPRQDALPETHVSLNSIAAEAALTALCRMAGKSQRSLRMERTVKVRKDHFNSKWKSFLFRSTYWKRV